MQKKKLEMQDIINNIKLMKIIRDINFMYKNTPFYKTNNLIQNNIYKNKKYYNLLKLIRNHFIYNSIQNNYSKKLTISILKKNGYKLL